ncbi:lipopolysaccharide biosynthesis protein [Shewanella oncorhynchi]|uniref:lipopolysaccharide biosynthesis protein n=1 Tax=Shewanella oncorhynchi TaxID=2726434 RepID=UPI003D7990BF
MLRNALYTSAPPIVRLVGGFILTPFILKSLGENVFTIWKVVTSIIAMSWLLQLGMNSYINRVIPYNLSKNNKDEIYEVVRTVRVFYRFVSILIVFIGLWYIGFVDNSQEYKVAFSICLLGYVIFTPLSYLKGVMTGHQEYVLLGKIDLFSYVLYFLLSLFLCFFWQNSYAFYFVSIIPIVVPVFFIYYFSNKNGYSYVRKGGVTFNTVKQAISYSSTAMMFSFVGMLYVNVTLFYLYDNFLVSAVTGYILIYQIVSIIPTILVMMLSTIKPELSRLDGLNDFTSINRIRNQIRLLIVSILVIYFFILSLHLNDILQIWIGSNVKLLSDRALLLLFVGQLSWCLLNLNYFVLNSIAKHTKLSALSSCVLGAFFLVSYASLNSYETIDEFTIWINTLLFLIMCYSSVDVNRAMKSKLTVNVNYKFSAFVCLVILMAINSEIFYPYRFIVSPVFLVVSLYIFYFNILTEEYQQIIKRKLCRKKLL